MSTDPSHDLADEKRQELLSRQLEEVIFIAAAIDHSTKSRARDGHGHLLIRVQLED